MVDPRRSFCLFAQGVSETYFKGISSRRRLFVNDIVAVQVRTHNNTIHIHNHNNITNTYYYFRGVYFVISVIYGGNEMPFMALTQ